MNAVNTRTTCPYCGVGCGVEVRSAAGKVEPVTGDKQHPANLGRLCVKGTRLHETLGEERRLLEPRIQGRPSKWDTALDAVSSRLRDTVAKHGPESVALYLSGQLLTEDYYVANKLWKGFLGSANVDTNSRLCMASAVAAHVRAFGEDVVPGCYEDVELADLLVMVGSNAAWAHPVLQQRILAEKERRPEMKLVVIDPRRTATCDQADLHLPIRPGGDAWLFNGLLAHLADGGHLDRDYLRNHTQGAEDAIRAARRSSPDIATTANHCGLNPADVKRFFDWFSAHPRTVTLFSQGINQSSSGSDKGNAILNCHLARGRVGRPGASPFSITGQPNAMGGREVGGLANQLAVHRSFSDDDRKAVGDFWGTSTVANKPGLKALDLFEAVERGKVKFIWILATNPLVSLPEADRWRRALERCDTVVVSDCVADTDTTAVADILLPATGWGEKDGTVTNSERRISRQRAFLPAAGSARPDWWALQQVAQRLGFAEAFAYTCPRDIFVEHAALSGINRDSPLRFDISGLASLDRENYDRLEPVQWPLPADSAQADAKRLFGDGNFATADGRARLLPIRPEAPRNRARKRYPLILNTGRTRDHWHTMTRTAESPELNRHRSEPYLDIHPADAKRFGLDGGDIARVDSRHGHALLRTRIDPDQQIGSVFVPMHWSSPHAAMARVDALIPAVLDPHSGQPELKHATVSVQRWPVIWQALLLSATPLDLDRGDYWAAHPVAGGWTYRMAGTSDSAEACRNLRQRLRGDVLLHYEGRSGAVQRMLKLEAGNVCGGLWFQADGAAPPEAWRLSQRLGRPLDDRERLAALDDQTNDAIICTCHRVSEAAICEAITHGATTARALGQQLRCGTQCGSCIPELNRLISDIQLLEQAS